MSSILVIVGVGAMRTDEALALARDAAAEGAAGLLMAPVSYTPLVDEEVYRHFVAVASATDLPLCIYSNPGTTKFTFSPELVARLAAVPTIAAIKLPLPAGSLPADLAAFREAAPGLSIGYSGDWGCKDALLAGADCWFSVAGGLFPKTASALTRAAISGDAVEANRLDAVFSGLWELFQAHGSLRLVHEGARIKGLTNASLPQPLLGIDDELRRTLISVLPE